MNKTKLKGIIKAIILVALFIVLLVCATIYAFSSKLNLTKLLNESVNITYVTDNQIASEQVEVSNLISSKPVLKDRVYNKISFIAKKDFNLSSMTFKISVNSGEVVKIDLQHNDKVIDVGNYLLGDTIVIEQDLKIKSGETLCIIFENTNTEFSIYKLNMKK